MMERFSPSEATCADEADQGADLVEVLTFLPVKVPNKMCAVAEQAAFGPVASEDEEEDGDN